MCVRKDATLMACINLTFSRSASLLITWYGDWCTRRCRSSASDGECSPRSTTKRSLARVASGRGTFADAQWHACSNCFDLVRYDTCIRRLYNSFGVPMSSMYVQKYFDVEAKDMVSDLIERPIKVVLDRVSFVTLRRFSY